MKKIRLFSTKATKVIEGDKAELYLNFYLVLNRDYIFTFLIDAPNLACSGRHPIRLWKHFLIVFENEYVKYLRRYESMVFYKKENPNALNLIALTSVMEPYKPYEGNCPIWIGFPKAKEMTIAEIEKELGYPVKIIKEK